MNIEELKANIGQLVVLDNSTKPYTWRRKKKISLGGVRDMENESTLKLIDIYDNPTQVGLKGNSRTYLISPKHIRLSDTHLLLTDNYKIKYLNKGEELEINYIFIDLGCKSPCEENATLPDSGYIYINDMKSENGVNVGDFNYSKNIEITLPQLRLLHKVKKHDVNDATTIDDNGNAWFIVYNGNNTNIASYRWDTTALEWKCRRPNGTEVFKDISPDIGDYPHNVALEHIEIECVVNGDDKTERMTYEQAVKAVLAGEKVQMLDFQNEWINIKDFYLGQILCDTNKFRIAPETILLEKKEYTKEQLVKIIEGMK